MQYKHIAKLSIEERETHYWIDAANDDTVVMETTILKDFNKAKKQGWTQTAQYLYEDDSVAGGCFKAPRRCLSIRNTTKREMSEEQKDNLQKLREQKKMINTAK